MVHNWTWVINENEIGEWLKIHSEIKIWNLELYHPTSQFIKSLGSLFHCVSFIHSNCKVFGFHNLVFGEHVIGFKLKIWKVANLGLLWEACICNPLNNFIFIVNLWFGFRI